MNGKSILDEIRVFYPVCKSVASGKSARFSGLSGSVCKDELFPPSLSQSLFDLLPLDCLRNENGDIGTELQTRPFLIVVFYIYK